MSREVRKLANQIRHMAAQAERLLERVESVCPEEFREGRRIDESDDLGYEWNRAHTGVVALTESLLSIAYELDPSNF